MKRLLTFAAAALALLRAAVAEQLPAARPNLATHDDEGHYRAFEKCLAEGDMATIRDFDRNWLDGVTGKSDRCPVHGTQMEARHLRIRSGFGPIESWEPGNPIRTHSFPFALLYINNGCGVPPIKTSPAYVCADCIRAEQAWKNEYERVERQQHELCAKMEPLLRSLERNRANADIATPLKSKLAPLYRALYNRTDGRSNLCPMHQIPMRKLVVPIGPPRQQEEELPDRVPKRGLPAGVAPESLSYLEREYRNQNFPFYREWLEIYLWKTPEVPKTGTTFVCPECVKEEKAWTSGK